MWWKKEIDDHCTLVIMRMFISIVYICVSIYIYSSSIYSDPQSLKIFSSFFLMLAFITLFPCIESIYSDESKHFVNMLSVAFAFYVIIIMHVYLFNAFGMSQTYDYIFSSFWLNIVPQLLIIFLIRKIYAKK